MDALLMFEGPVIEVHMSNIHRREKFRHRTFTSLAATASICGLGPLGYALAIDAMAELIAARAMGLNAARAESARA
jgi:3-dehydroquinate dehydratase-2